MWVLFRRGTWCDHRPDGARIKPDRHLDDSLCPLATCEVGSLVPGPALDTCLVHSINMSNQAVMILETGAFPREGGFLSLPQEVLIRILRFSHPLDILRLRTVRRESPHARDRKT